MLDEREVFALWDAQVAEEEVAEGAADALALLGTEACLAATVASPDPDGQVFDSPVLDQWIGLCD